MNNVFNNENINYLTTDPNIAEQIQQQRERMALAEAYRQNSFKLPAVKNKTGRAFRGWGQAFTSLGKALTDWGAENKIEELRNQDKQARADAQNLQGIIDRYDSGERPSEDYYDGSEAFNQALGNMESQPQNYGYDPREGLVQSLVQQQGGEMPQGRFGDSAPLYTKQAQTLQDAMRMSGIDPDNLNYYQQQIMTNRGQQQQALAQKIAEREANMQDFYNKEAIKAGFNQQAIQQKADNTRALEEEKYNRKLAEEEAAVMPPPTPETLPLADQKVLDKEFSDYRDRAIGLNSVLDEAEALFGENGIFSPNNPQTANDQDDGAIATNWGLAKDKWLGGSGEYTRNYARALALFSEKALSDVKRLTGSISEKELQFLQNVQGLIGTNPDLQQIIGAGRELLNIIKRGKEDLMNKARPRIEYYQDKPASRDYIKSIIGNVADFAPILEPTLQYGG